MSQFFSIHPEDPQHRLITHAVDIIKDGGVIVYPTESSYALGCQLGNKDALERIRRIRQLDDQHNFTLVCRDLSELATYARIGNRAFRFLKTYTPGAYTFILKASREVPRRLQHPKRKTIGIRVPDNKIIQALLTELAQPLMSTTITMPGDELPLTDPQDIQERLGNQVDLIIDGGACGVEMTTVVDLEGDEPELIRVGMGDPAPFE